MKLNKENLKNFCDKEYEHMKKWSSATGSAMALIQSIRKEFEL